MKRHTSQCDPARPLLHWLNTTLQTQQVQVQQLGNGLAYCLLMHHYFPAMLSLRNVILVPRRHADYLCNLKYLNEVFHLLKWHHLSFNISKVASNSYQDNLQLLSQMHATIVQSEIMSKKGMIENGNNNNHNNNHNNNILVKQNTVDIHKTQNYYQFPNNTFSFGQMPNNMGKSTPQGIYSMVSCGIATPNRMNRPQKNQIIQQIKSIIDNKDKNDKQKVKQLKQLLHIEIQSDNFIKRKQKDLLCDDHQQITIIIEEAE